VTISNHRTNDRGRWGLDLVTDDHKQDGLGAFLRVRGV